MSESRFPAGMKNKKGKQQQGNEKQKGQATAKTKAQCGGLSTTVHDETVNLRSR
jgi:hypothetical protein